MVLLFVAACPGVASAEGSTAGTNQLEFVLEPGGVYWWKVSEVEVGTPVVARAEALNASGEFVVGVAFTTTIGRTLGDTPYVAAAVVNATTNATLEHSPAAGEPRLFLVAFSLVEPSPAGRPLRVNCSAPVQPYSYDRYYSEVLLPSILSDPRIVAVVVAAGAGGVVVTASLINRRRAEKRRLVAG
ncbi:MAG: hypothetical protein Kow0069_02870 [Promethearchaeota archaeon]